MIQNTHGVRKHDGLSCVQSGIRSGIAAVLWGDTESLLWTLSPSHTRSTGYGEILAVTGDAEGNCELRRKTLSS